jgi:hypothetical protein
VERGIRLRIAARHSEKGWTLVSTLEKYQADIADRTRRGDRGPDRRR